MTNIIIEILAGYTLISLVAGLAIGRTIKVADRELANHLRSVSQKIGLGKLQKRSF